MDWLHLAMSVWCGYIRFFILFWHVLNELMKHEEGRKRIKALAGLFCCFYLLCRVVIGEMVLATLYFFFSLLSRVLHHAMLVCTYFCFFFVFFFAFLFFALHYRESDAHDA